AFLLPLLVLLGLGTYGYLEKSGGLRIDSSAKRLLDSDPRSRETFEKFGELIPDTEMVLVALEMDNLFSNEGAAVLNRASERMLLVGGCVEVKSLTHSGRPVREGFQLIY